MDEKKLELLQKYAEKPYSIQDASLDEKATYVDLVIEGCAYNVPEALDIMAYACYGGNEFFECDWKQSESCLLKLIEIFGDKRAYYHNSLGYLYFYGRVGGKPNYEKAFQHFTIGAINGHTESICKLSDMLIDGIGVPKSPSAGTKLLLDIYQLLLNNFRNEEYSCNYADVSVRLGRIMEKNIFDDNEPSLSTAFSFYNCAKYAINLRRTNCKEQFDDQIEAKIVSDYNRVKALLPDDYFKNELILDCPEPLGVMLEGSAGVDIELYKEAEEWYIKGTRLVGEEMLKHAFLNYPEVDICKLVDEFSVRLVNVSEETTAEYDTLPVKAFVNEISGIGDGCWEFKYGGKVMMKVKCEGFGVGRVGNTIQM